MKYVLVTGGVVSGLGKGVTASSIGVVLKACGLRVTSVKIGQFFETPFLLSFKWFLGLGSFLAACVFSLDLHLPEGEREEGKRKSGCCNVECGQLEEDADPYLNTDAGTMSPFEHGEVFVLDDGGEV
jgi:CTP synthase